MHAHVRVSMGMCVYMRVYVAVCMYAFRLQASACDACRCPHMEVHALNVLHHACLVPASLLQIYALHHAAPGVHMVTHTPAYVDLFATSRFCLAPTGGGHSKGSVLVRRA